MSPRAKSTTPKKAVRAVPAKGVVTPKPIPQQPNLISVEILYCRTPSGVVYKQEVHLTFVNGLWWGPPCKGCPPGIKTPNGLAQIPARTISGVPIRYRLAADCKKGLYPCPLRRGAAWWKSNQSVKDPPIRARQLASLLSVEITYGDDAGQMWKKEVNLDRAAGIYWGPLGSSSAGLPKLATKAETSIEGTKVRPPPPNGPSCCWYDPETGQWHCPDAF